MEAYVKSQVIEPPDLKTVLPFKSLPINFIHMTVKSGSKVRNIIGYAISNFQKPEAGCIVFSGSGTGITKTISCAEIMKKKFKDLHQMNKIHYILCQEIWEPEENDLDLLKVKRDIPAIHILLSKLPLDEKEPGFQSPGLSEAFWRNPGHKQKSQQGRKNPSRPTRPWKKRPPPREFKPQKKEQAPVDTTSTQGS